MSMSNSLDAARTRRREKFAGTPTLDEAIDKSIALFFSESDTVGPDARHKLRHLLRYYAKKTHPFTACVHDNMKRFGPGRTERVCATLKDIIRGTTHWRGHPELDHGAPGAIAASAETPEIDDEVAAILMAASDEIHERVEALLFSAGGGS